MIKFFKSSKNIGYPVKEILQEIKNNPQFYEVEIRDKNNPTILVNNKEKPSYSFYIFQTCSPILSTILNDRMWYNSEEIEWMNDKEKSYVYHELLKFKPEANKNIRDKWAKAYNIKKEEQ